MLVKLTENFRLIVTVTCTNPTWNVTDRNKAELTYRKLSTTNTWGNYSPQ